jgi:GNAT superfamily N-acetyltransferase
LLVPLVSEYWAFEGMQGFDKDRISLQLKRLFQNTSLGAGWIAFSGNRPIGYLLAVYVFSLEHSGITAEIDEFFVLSSHRGTGVGAGLLAAAESQFAQVGCLNVSLQLGRENEAARDFYHRHGYKHRSGYTLLEKNLAADTPTDRTTT